MLGWQKDNLLVNFRKRGKHFTANEKGKRPINRIILQWEKKGRKEDNSSPFGTVVTRKLEKQCLEGRKTAASPRKWAHHGYTMHKNQVAPFLCMPVCFYCADRFLLCSIILCADLLRTDTLGNFRWCCNVLAIENSSLLCRKCSVDAFFSNFTGSVAKCYLIYIQFMSWLAGTCSNFRGRRIFFLIVTGFGS